MSETLQQQLAKVLDTLLTSAQQGAAWVGEQLPPLVQEIVVMGRVDATLACLTALALLGWTVLWTVKLAPALIRRAESHHADEGPLLGLLILGSLATLCGSIAGLLQLFASYHQLALAWFAPRLYLIEYLKETLQ